MTVSPLRAPSRTPTSIDAVGVRPATGTDCVVLTAMVRDSAAYSGRYRVMVANQTIDERYVLAHPVRVAVAGSEIVGFYSLLVPGCGGDGEGELDFMFVANGYQRRGIGRLLFDDLRRTAAHLRLRRIHIVSHPPAEAFYRAQGARLLGVEPPAGRVTWSRPHLIMSVDPRLSHHGRDDEDRRAMNIRTWPGPALLIRLSMLLFRMLAQVASIATVADGIQGRERA